VKRKFHGGRERRILETAAPRAARSNVMLSRVFQALAAVVTVVSILAVAMSGCTIVDNSTDCTVININVAPAPGAPPPPPPPTTPACPGDGMDSMFAPYWCNIHAVANSNNQPIKWRWKGRALDLDGARCIATRIGEDRCRQPAFNCRVVLVECFPGEPPDWRDGVCDPNQVPTPTGAGSTGATTGDYLQYQGMLPDAYGFSADGLGRELWKTEPPSEYVDAEGRPWVEVK
jgi:hypothetical protein